MELVLLSVEPNVGNNEVNIKLAQSVGAYLASHNMPTVAT